MTGLTGLLGICFGLLVLLPACSTQKKLIPDISTKQSDVQYKNNKDGVTVSIRELTRTESNALFNGRGFYLFSPLFPDQEKDVQGLLVQITNDYIKPIHFSRNEFSMSTLGLHEVYNALCKETSSDRMSLGLLLVSCLHPLVAIYWGCFALLRSSDSKNLWDIVDESLLDQTLTVYPGETVKRVVADASGTTAFDLIISDVGSNPVTRKFEVTL